MLDYILTPMTRVVKPFPQQKLAIDWTLKEKYTLNASEMGTGKTLMALDVIFRTKLPAVIIAPAYLTHTWLLEINKFYTGMKAEIFKGQNHMDSDVVICSPERMKNIEVAFRQSPIWIIDEAQYFCNPETKRTKFLNSMVNKYRPEYFILSTGTPIQNRVLELWQLLYMLSKYRGENFRTQFPNKWRFADTFSNRQDTVFGIKYEGIRNGKALSRIMEQMSFKVFLSDIIDLPEMENQIITFQDDYIDEDLENKLQEAYFGGHIGAIKAKSALAKAKFTGNFLSSLIESESGPVVCFSDHVEVLQVLSTDLGKKLRVKVITGEVPIPRRQEIVKLFQAGHVDILLATIGAAGTGITLTQSSTLVFNDHSWVPARNAQASRRILRIGQDKQCRCISIARDGVDLMITKALRAKMEVIAKTDLRSLKDVDAENLFAAENFL